MKEEWTTGRSEQTTWLRHSYTTEARRAGPRVPRYRCRLFGPAWVFCLCGTRRASGPRPIRIGRVVRAVPGFEEFLKRFPPPDGLDPAKITHIVKDVIQTEDKFPISITLRYLAAGQRSAPVAAFSDVEGWAAETRFGWISWIVAAVGWLIVASTELYGIVGADRRLTDN